MKKDSFIGNDPLSQSSLEQIIYASNGPDGSPEKKGLGVILKNVFPKKDSWMGAGTPIKRGSLRLSEAREEAINAPLAGNWIWDIQKQWWTTYKELTNTSQEGIGFEHSLNLVSVFTHYDAQRKSMSDYISTDEEGLFLAFASPQSFTSILEEPEASSRGGGEKERKATVSTKPDVDLTWGRKNLKLQRKLKLWKFHRTEHINHWTESVQGVFLLLESNQTSHGANSILHLEKN